MLQIQKIASFFLFIVLFFNFSACSQLRPNTQVVQCKWKDINLDGNNSFCSSIRTSLVFDNTLLVAFDNGAIITWNLESKKKILEYETTSDFTRRALLLEKNKLISGSSDMRIYVHSLNGKQIDEKSYNKGTVFDITSFRDKLYVAFGNAEIGVINSNTLELLSTYKKHEYLIYSLFLDREKKLLYSASDDNSIIEWSILEDGTLHFKRRVVQYSNSLKQILKYKDTFIITTGNGKLLLYNESFDTQLSATTAAGVNIIATLLDGDRLYVGDLKGNLFIYRLKRETFELEKTLHMESRIRSIQKYKNCIIIMTKSGVLKTLS